MKYFWIVLVVLSFCPITSAEQTPKKSQQVKQPKQQQTTETRIVKLALDSQSVAVLHVRAGYVSSVRMPEEVSSVVLGDPTNFRAEHTDAEPRMVFIKPISTRSTETNVLITTIAGREVSLHLINDPKSEASTIDFVVDYEPPRTMLIPPTISTFTVPDTGTTPAVSDNDQKISDPLENLLRTQSKESVSEWQGKQLQLVIGRLANGAEQQMRLTFSVRNASPEFIELLPPELVLLGSSSDRKKKTKAEPLPTTRFLLSTRRLAPGTRADGVIEFERPSFKEAIEQLMLQIAAADKADQPVQIPVPFTASETGRAK